MSAPTIARPGSVERYAEIRDTPQQEIAKLAYALWQERGAPPDGLGEEDWIEAERRLRGEEAATGPLCS